MAIIDTGDESIVRGCGSKVLLRLFFFSASFSFSRAAEVESNYVKRVLYLQIQSDSNNIIDL